MKKAQRVLGALVASALSTTAFATNGYFAHGYGTASKGLAGAGVALPQSAMVAATNPAGMVHVGTRMDIGAALFAPLRSYSTGPGLFAAQVTDNDSGRNLFLVPSFAYNRMLDDKSSVGVAVYGNGGMNTFYDDLDTFNLGGSLAGVDLMQLFVAPTYSRKLNDKVSIGVSALLAYQRFEAHGIEPFALLSSNGQALSNVGYDDAFGYGARIGILAQVSDRLTLGASYQSRVYMSEFDKYAGLFAEQGDFDIPSNFTVGLAFKARPDVTIALDVQHIMYSEVDSIANPMQPGFNNCGLGGSGPDTSFCLGGANGMGFGWDDMTIVKLGAQWQYDPTLTLRAGVSYGEQPIPSTEVMFNILAPAVMEVHITGGFTKKLDKNSSFSMAAMWAPENSVSGTSPDGSLVFGQDVELTMSQFEIEASYSKTWD